MQLRLDYQRRSLGVSSAWTDLEPRQLVYGKVADI